MDVGVAHLTGITLASVAAVAFALYYLCVRLATTDGDVLGVMLVSLVTNVLMFVPLAGLVHGIPELTILAVLSFVAAGLAGSFFSRLAVMKSVEAIGASRTSPIVASNVFIASILAIILFDEQLTFMHIIGIVFIVGGVAAITYETASGSGQTVTLREFGATLVLPVLGAALIGVEPIFVTIGFEEGAPILPGVAIKATAATVGFVAYLSVTRTLKPDRLRWGPNRRWYLGAGLTSGIGILALFAALEAAPVVIVIPLIQTAPLIVVVLSLLFLPRHLERITLRLVIGAVIVVVGATLVSLFG